MSSTAGRAASVLRDGVVYSGSAIVNGVNAITPHFAGAVDILVVRQPDGSLKSTPFYVRFGKYSSFRARDRRVRIFVNDLDTSLEMHLGSYGQAYFVAEVAEVGSGAFLRLEGAWKGPCLASENDAVEEFGGLLSSPSGYSSNDDEEDAPYANAEILEAVRMKVCDTLNKQTQDPSMGRSEESTSRQRTDRASGERAQQSGISQSISEQGEVADIDSHFTNLPSGHHCLQGPSLISVKSCPSFQTSNPEPPFDEEASEGELERHVEFFSTAGSPESSALHNNALTGFTDPDIQFPPDFGQEAVALEVSSRHLMADNDGYDGDTEPGKLKEAPNAVPFFTSFELSLCGHLLESDMSSVEAQTAFEAHQVLKEEFEENGLRIAQDPNLVCRLNGILYPWSAAMPMVMGMLAFGGKWEHLLQQSSSRDATSTGQPKASDSAEKTSSGWRLWPFGSRSDKHEAAVQEAVPQKEGTEQRRLGKKKVLSPTPEQLTALNLENGRNVISYRLGDSVRQEAYIYVMSWSSRLVISDIDGTVTRSDLLGHLLTPIGVDWTHSGVAHLFSNIKANGYEIMFLSSRAIAQANITRDFLHRLEQEGVRMPLGPVIISPHGLLPSLYREMILRRPHDFKIGCLQDVRQLFPDHWNPFYAGFGNRETDVISYEESGVPPSRIFTINPRGLIIRGASSCVQSSTWSSLQGINELVDEVFPCYSQGLVTEMQREEFNEFQHWRTNDVGVFSDDPELADIMLFYTPQSSMRSMRQDSMALLNE